MVYTVQYLHSSTKLDIILFKVHKTKLLLKIKKPFGKAIQVPGNVRGKTHCTQEL